MIHTPDHDPLAGSITEEVLAARRAERYSFHMPGHKGGRGASALAHEVLGSGTIALDVSELAGFDYLHAAQGGVAESHRRAAKLFGADASWFLVNGATVGNLAAVFATTTDDDEALVLRGSHRSVYAGLTLSGAHPRYVPPVHFEALDGFFGADVATARRIVAERGSRIAMVHVTRPTYYGFCVDLEPWLEIAESLDVPLVVDEAHGTHFVFADGLPTPALAAGADVVVHSPHKTLSSLTQSSMMHSRGTRVDRVRLNGALAMLQSSSPSALLLASLDLACAHMADQGHELWTQVVALARDVRPAVDAIAGLHVVGEEILGIGGIDAIDPTKLVIDVSALHVTGWQVAASLRSDHGVNPEFADARRIICSLTLGDDPTTTEALLESLGAVSQAVRTGAIPTATTVASASMLPEPEVALSPRRAAQARTVVVPIDQAAGRVAAEFVIPYPPGIPMIVPGEVVEIGTLKEAQRLRGDGAAIVGAADPELTTLRVVVEEPAPLD